MKFHEFLRSALNGGELSVWLWAVKQRKHPLYLELEAQWTPPAGLQIVTRRKIGASKIQSAPDVQFVAALLIRLSHSIFL
jgi:hypothetical protein